MSDEMKTCPQCSSPYGYDTGNGNYECPECSHNWDPNEKSVEKPVEKVQDTIHSDNATHTGTFRNQPNKMVRQAEFTLQILQH